MRGMTLFFPGNLPCGSDGPAKQLGLETVGIRDHKETLAVGEAIACQKTEDPADQVVAQVMSFS